MTHPNTADTGTQYDLFERTLSERADQWLQTPAGKEAVRLFVELAHAAKCRGFRRYGAKAIMEAVRWEHKLKHGPQAPGLKINNNYPTYIARHVEKAYPDLRGFFEKRATGQAIKRRRAVVVPIREAGQQ